MTFSIPLAVISLLGLLFSYGHYYRGLSTDKRPLKIGKLAIYGIWSIAIYGAWLALSFTFNPWELIAIPFLFGALILMFAPDWSPAFPYHAETYNELSDLPKWIVKLTNKIVGYEYGLQTTLDKAIKWKVIAGNLKWGFYSLPLLGVLCTLSCSLWPLTLTILTFNFNTIYRYFFKKFPLNPDNLQPGDKLTGFALGIGIGTVLYLKFLI